MKRITLFATLIFVACSIFGQSPSDTSSHKQIDSTQLYGFISQLPVKVGGGPLDQRKYLESLRDAQGKKVSYERKGSCCQYPSSSPDALFGTGMLDVYEITYRDIDNKKQKVSIYISFYDFEKPKPIKGFTFEE
jgi:hypothetical protein